MATRAELIATATEWLSLWNAPIDWERFDRIHADDFRDRSPAGRPATKQGFAQGLREFAEAFPDLRAYVRDLVVDHEHSSVAIRWLAHGTNAGRYLGIGPTNRRTTITGIEIVRVRDGQVVRRWGEWDISDHREEAAG